MSADDNLQFVIKVRGGPAAAADVRGLTKELDALTTTTGKASVQTKRLGEESKRSGFSLASSARQVVAYGLAFKGVQTVMAAIGSGFRFDAVMEQNTVAFTHFLGSAKAAHEELSTLFDIAAHTPFEMSDVTTATRRFLAFGFSVEQANKELLIAGDAIAGAGLGAEGMNQLVRALGQIQAKGRLQGDELLQLSELGIIGPQQIAKQMGMTQTAFQKALTAGKVSSEEAITAINAVLVAQFKGSAAEQSKTLIGQLSTAKDYGAQAAGALVQPLVDFAKSSVLPRLTKFFMDAGAFLKAPQGQGLLQTLADIAGKLTPLIALWLAYKGAVVALNWALGIYDALQVAGLLAGQARAAILLIPAVTGLADAWWLMNAAIEGTWLAAAGPVGWLAAALIAIGALYWKWKAFHDLMDATVKRLVQLQGLLDHPLGTSKGGAPSLASKGAGIVQGAINPFAQGKRLLGQLHELGFMASGGNLRVGGSAIVGEAGPELAQNRGGHTTITPLTTPGAQPARRVLQPLYLQVDGRVFAEVMVDVGQTAAARR